MELVSLASETDFEGWRTHARRLLGQNVSPEEVMWRTPECADDLFSSSNREHCSRSPPAHERAAAPKQSSAPLVPAAFIAMARRVIAHRDTERLQLLYRILWRLQTTRGLLKNAADSDIAWLHQRDQSVRRDVHKMHAFVRFRAAGVAPDGRECFAAWFEPTHRIASLAAPFFQARFTQMNWLIVTPDTTIAWDGAALLEGPGGARSDAPAEDELEHGWRVYYASIFNPARLKVRTMQGQIPKKYWPNLPEAQLIPQLIVSAQARQDSMIANGVTSPNPRSLRILAQRLEPVATASDPGSLHELREQSAACQRCPLYACASQTVFGEGAPGAQMMIVGEQPGDEEDIAGRPFVGPAGKVLDVCLREAGVSRHETYLTNAVKHFKYTPRGKRRIHERPNAGEIDRCKWWLDRERSFVRPRVIVSMGATAYRGLTGKSVRIGDVRGRAIALDDFTTLIATVHPAYLLRLPDEEARNRERSQFIADLRKASELLLTPGLSDQSGPDP